jgi:hypothetical protein
MQGEELEAIAVVWLRGQENLNSGNKWKKEHAPEAMRKSQDHPYTAGK